MKVLLSAAKWTLVFVGLLASIAILALLWPTARAPLPQPSREFVINNVRVVDVEAGTAGQPTSVVISNGRIQAIGTHRRREGVAILDADGRFLVPGYWDMHVHTFQLSPQMHLPLWVANGVTSIRDMMGCPGERDSLIACEQDKRRWNREVRAGKLTSPRIVSTASYYFEDPALTPADVSSRAQAAAARGSNELKVYNRISQSSYAQLSKEAKGQGLRLVGHLPKAVTLTEALNAGQRSFEHAHLFARHCFRRSAQWRGGELDTLPATRLIETMMAEYDPTVCEDAFGRIRKAGAWLVPTHVTREDDARASEDGFVNDPRLVYLDPMSRWAYRDDLSGTRSEYPGDRGERALSQYFEHGIRLTGAAHKAGVPILVGTDTVLGGFRYHDELAHLARAGLSPAEVLRAATINAAKYVGLERQTRSIEVGKMADLVLLDENPLSDVRNLRRIRAIVLDGRIYDRAGSDELLQFAREQAARPDSAVKLIWGFARSSVAGDL